MCHGSKLSIAAVLVQKPPGSDNQYVSEWPCPRQETCSEPMTIYGYNLNGRIWEIFRHLF